MSVNFFYEQKRLRRIEVIDAYGVMVRVTRKPTKLRAFLRITWLIVLTITGIANLCIGSYIESMWAFMWMLVMIHMGNWNFRHGLHFE